MPPCKIIFTLHNFMLTSLVCYYLLLFHTHTDMDFTSSYYGNTQQGNDFTETWQYSPEATIDPRLLQLPPGQAASSELQFSSGLNH
jgi:hypothetical protein